MGGECLPASLQSKLANRSCLQRFELRRGVGASEKDRDTHSFAYLGFHKEVRLSVLAERLHNQRAEFALPGPGFCVLEPASVICNDDAATIL